MQQVDYTSVFLNNLLSNRSEHYYLSPINQSMKDESQKIYFIHNMLRVLDNRILSDEKFLAVLIFYSNTTDINIMFGEWKVTSTIHDENECICSERSNNCYHITNIHNSNQLCICSKHISKFQTNNIIPTIPINSRMCDKCKNFNIESVYQNGLPHVEVVTKVNQ